MVVSCEATKRVPRGERLLVENKVLVNKKVQKEEEITQIVLQQPNSKVLNIPFSLHIYNLAKPNPDSSFKAKVLYNPKRFKRLSALLSEKQVYRLGESFWYKGFHNFLKNSGDAPIVFNKNRADKSIERLKQYYFNQGYFNAKALYKLDTLQRKRVKVTYEVETGLPYFLDSIKRSISSPQLDSLYILTQELSFIKSGQQYKTENFDNERNRLTNYFRNNGIYNFQPTNISFEIIDTARIDKKPNVELIINDYSYRKGDSIKTKPFKIFKISKVNIFTDNISDKNRTKIQDSVTYNKFNIYSRGKIRFKPKAITDAIFIQPGSIYADYKTNLTSRYLNNLKVFNLPSIQYIEDKSDTTKNALIANIYLITKQKYIFEAAFDLIHSNIQDFGITGNVSTTITNVFNGAETFQISARGNVGASRSFANPNNNFFNISEYGIDMRLNFPRIFFPLSTEKVVPKTMLPTTTLALGFAKQQNIGLDKQNLTGFFTYNWTPKRLNNVRFDLFNIQYVNNLNTSNYFIVYRSSYGLLNQIAQNYQTLANPEYFNTDGNLIIDSGTAGFVNDALNANPPFSVTNEDLKDIRSINERRSRLSENNFILATSYSFSKTTKANLLDNTFHVFKVKLETAGNLLSLFAKATNQPLGPNGNRTLFDIEFSQYVKTELEFIKHIEIDKNTVFACRAFAGIAIPYGNSINIPFSRSYFAGGSNDNRAWQPYSLGPGRSGGNNDFNEANLKLAASVELRYKITGKFKGAIFIDTGNIWNLLDNVTDTDFTFNGFSSIKDFAIGSGTGLRYDFGFVVARFDLGFITYNPSREFSQKWFRDYNFANSVFNIGINYPF